MQEPPELRHKNDSEISLSGTAVAALLSAVHEKGADFRFKASGWSMFPIIRHGDFITLSPPEDIKPVCGDVLAFCHPESGKLIIHRVIEVSQESFLAKGDNSLDPDGLIPNANVLGVVTRVERNRIAIFWPDIRHFSRSARCYFRIQKGILHLKTKLYMIYKGMRDL
jgi:signal peptidase I